MSAPTPPPPHHHHHSLNADHIFSSNSALLVAAIAFLLLVLLFVLLLHLYAKCFLLPHSSPLPPTLPTFPPPPPRQDPPSPTKGGGLDSSAVASIPLFEYVGGALGPLECVICLGAFRDGDVGRALPTCAHRAFHADCIDTWLLSRSTCPVCRAPVTASPAAIESSAVLGAEEESQEEPSSVVIEITGANENENDDRNHEPPPSVQQPLSMGRSLRRMVSRDNRLDRKIYPSCSSSSVANHVQLHDS